MRVVTATIGVACAGYLGYAGFAVLTGFSASSSPSSPALQTAEPAPVEAIAARFPSFQGAPAARPAAYALAAVAPTIDLDMFSSTPLYAPAPAAQAAARATAPVAALPPQAEKTPAAPAAVKQTAAVQTAAPATQSAAAAAPHRQPAARPGGVLNDAQIAGIRKRLNLTPAQEAMWPAVAAALHNIVYSKNAEARAHAAQPGTAAMAYIDPNSDEVRQLKYAALPLIMQLNDDQRREVKLMAHVMGLESVASQF